MTNDIQDSKGGIQPEPPLTTKEDKPTQEQGSQRVSSELTKDKEKIC